MTDTKPLHHRSFPFESDARHFADGMLEAIITVQKLFEANSECPEPSDFIWGIEIYKSLDHPDTWICEWRTDR